MEERLEKVEQRLTALERDVAVIRSNYVTKDDLHREMAALHDRIIRSMQVEFVSMRGQFESMHGEIANLYRVFNSQTWKLVTFVCGFGTALVAATFFIATQVK
jgi:hypothetical protein